MADWILQCSPRVWDVFRWWEESDEELADWTVSRHLADIQPGDRFAFWVGGAEPGVYALGTITGSPRPGRVVGGGYWLRAPIGSAWRVDLDTRKYLFDQPIRKGDLLLDKDFSDALIIRMPRSPNPIPLTTRQWQAISRRAGSRIRPRPTRTDPRVTTRSLGSVKEETTVAPASVERVRVYREAQLVRRYERFLRRPLEIRSVVLASGERLVVDAFDQTDDLLIEAKATSTRQDVRMAIGQLLDYRRHIASRSSIAVLLPDRPSDDLLDLLRSASIQVIFETRRGRFRTL
jgi:hypothetical protein